MPAMAESTTYSTSVHSDMEEVLLSVPNCSSIALKKAKISS